MVTCVNFDGRFEMPLDVQTLDRFRGWAMSDAFPDQGRIDFVGGRIEVDMSPEDLFSHGVIKVEIVRVLSQLIKDARLGYLFTDSTRVSCPDAKLSVEPDIVFVSHTAISRERIRLVPKAGGKGLRYAELEGPPDMVAEIVSDSSVVKDTRQLPDAYYHAGVQEFWLIDGRGENTEFAIHHRGAHRFEPVVSDRNGFQESSVFSRRFRLSRTTGQAGHHEFQLSASSLD
jgi:Uma2 family endonuclease